MYTLSYSYLHSISKSSSKFHQIWIQQWTFWDSDSGIYSYIGSTDPYKTFIYFKTNAHFHFLTSRKSCKKYMYFETINESH
jgi:hypothetical protein